jgi:hypothetical protein
MKRIGALAMAGMLLAGCYGPFHLTRRLWTWNGQVGDKWVNEVVFLVMSILPIYYVAGAADTLIFNSIEFWTGDNPMAAGPKTVTVAQGGTEVTMTMMPTRGHEQVILQQSQNGKAGPTLHVERANGQTIGRNEQGDVVFMATAQADGGVLVTDAQGQQVASYTGKDVRRFYESLPQ